MRAVRSIAVAAFLLPLLMAAHVTQASASGPFYGGEHLRLATDKTHTGDMYVWTVETRIDGVVDGDLIAWTATARIDGEVTGDLNVGTSQFDLNGKVGDTVRVFAHKTAINGHIDGDLLLFSGMVTIDPDAHITGDLIAFAGRLTLDGTVDGDVRVTGGEIDVGGTVAGNAEIEADALTLTSNCRIAGDLTHLSRQFRQHEGAEVAGRVIEEEPEEVEEEDEGISLFGIVLWFWGTLSAMLIGLIWVVALRRLVPSIKHAIGGETMMGTLIGFGAFLVVPAASLLALVFLPLGLIGIALFLVAVYVAKMPLAVWLGDRLLSLLGLRSPSPFVAVVLGLLILRLLFLIPYLGTLLWLVAVWLGLGAMILAVRSRLQQRAAEPGTP
jgi:cytoskeletal protein CcmA (bactofilin family)